ncbi:P-loop containing nucleoside triphosphate hydrolase protein [Xylariaceae sp. FL0255]|nr:P-loop containing nucleoside triphosphate hydrolase protein [Xylariaceae sp. FL0255]
MYSRYIPPAKGAEKSSLAPSSQAPSKPATATTYARYIPPPRSQSAVASATTSATTQHVHFGENDDNLPRPLAKKIKFTEEEPNPESRKKSKKKNRKSVQAENITNDVEKQRKVDQEARVDESGADAEVIDNDLSMVDEAVSSPRQDSPVAEQIREHDAKPKREKKKRKQPKGDVQTSTQTEDPVPTRHRAILEKKAKSIQKPSEEDVAEGMSQDVPMSDAPAAMESNIDDGNEREKTPEVELHGLEPIPQPKPVPLDISIPTYETLPPWLASPIRISQDSSASWTSFGLSPDLGITPAIAERLGGKGYKQAFAIQTGVVPLLLPHHCKTMQGDVLVSAATGSGKTLAYTLPLVRDLSQGSRHVTKLRALIVLPTRELVKQVQQVCEQCAGVFALDGAKRRPKIAMAMGSQSLEQEQTLLIDREERYDPEAYARKMKRLARLSRHDDDNNDEDDEEVTDSGYNTEDEEREAIRQREDRIKTLPDYVIAYKSKVDVLICTPGRLVEHVKFTPGFTLDFVRWLIVDEADKLLGQNFQQWLDVVIPRLQSNDVPGARNHKQSNLSGVRKVVLSATMTRDLDQLEGLKLRRPKLIILEGSESQDTVKNRNGQAEHVLPGLLEEAAIKVSDPNLKPLFLVDLLRSSHILDDTSRDAATPLNSDDDTSSSGSDSESDSDSDTEISKEDVMESSAPKSAGHKTTKKLPTVLIFTKSNETTLRLSRLLTLLAPAYKSLIGTLTSTTPYTTRRDTIQSFVAGKRRILVASDLVARGIDLPSLDHVINYDIPSSVASYVHRVGRTARAGNTGQAWTLFTNPEARWFWNEIAGEKVIQRSGKVERTRITEEKEDAFDNKVAAYEAALEKLGQEAGDSRRQRRRE